MYIEPNHIKFIATINTTLGEVIKKIDENKGNPVFITDDHGKLIGAITDGDIRRGLLTGENSELNNPIRNFVQKDILTIPQLLSDTDRRIKINSYINNTRKNITHVPELDAHGKITNIYSTKAIPFHIGDRYIDQNSPVFIIAEIGNNHNGDITQARSLVDAAVEAGVDCVKFQMRDMKDLYDVDVKKKNSHDLGSQYTLDLLEKFQLTDSEMYEVLDYCVSRNVLPLCTPWDITSFKKLHNYGLTAYKVASADLTNTALLNCMATEKVSMIISTGMSTENELMLASQYLESQNANYMFLHCNSTYPTPFKDVNLSYLQRLKEITQKSVGYSGHERGYHIPLAAVALGAKVIEKHVTFDRTLEGNDHKVSLLPDELKLMVQQIRDIETSMLGVGERKLSQGELINRETLAKSIVASEKIPIGKKITLAMLSQRSPGQGLQPIYMNNLVGKRAKRNFEAGDIFFNSDLNDDIITPRDYQFERPYGIPIRFHDYEKLITGSSIDFVEFHLSYTDLKMHIPDFINKPQKLGYAVHIPELFPNDHILDLSSTDTNYSQNSLNYVAQTIDKTLALREFFPNQNKPIAILNAGGFTENYFVDKKQKHAMYDRVAQNLKKLDTQNIRIAIQTMPPFPWHFGGQRHHNLFVDPDEIAQFCENYGYQICLDISHSQMACTYYGWNLEKFIERIGKHVIYLHIVDCDGVDGEGVQIGHGDVDFKKLGLSLKAHCPNIPFVPEIWQGHKNNGEGFWEALNFLDGRI
jgi:sialic acid synthase SpsE